MTDAIDLRTIDVILKDFYNEKILTDDYAFSASGIYYSCPIDKGAPQDGYMSYLDTLPLNPDPEVFGLHSNANITCALNETYETFDTMLLLQPRTAAGAGKSREEVIAERAAGIEERLPENFDIEAVGMQYPVMYEESYNTVLQQECMRYQKLLLEIKRTLAELQKALKGQVVMSTELENMGTSLYNQKIPAMWEAKAYPSMKPLDPWIQEFLDRIGFIRGWIANGKPALYWFSGFFFPQAFLTGTLQNFARKYYLPIDTVSFDFLMKSEKPEEVKEAPEDGCYVHGLFIEGARWDFENKTLTDSRPKELYTSLPILHLNPKQNRVLPTEGVYRCPVYKILSRWGQLSTTGHSTNFVMWLEIPSARTPITNNIGLADDSYFIKQGVAAFCSLRF